MRRGYFRAASWSGRVTTRWRSASSPRTSCRSSWRRLNPRQIVPQDIDQPEHIRLINADSHATVLGLFLNEFAGIWINDVTATRAAENKLVQLQAAAIAGLAVPRTLVSNDPAAIRAFCRALDGEVIVKAVRGTSGFHLFTRQVTEEHLASDDCLRLSPAIYQEKIKGQTHLRLHCFGEDFLVAHIHSAGLDWRENIDVPFVAFEIDAQLKRQVRGCLDRLGLRMGIVDLKLTEAGTPVWLEVNPQGQYLFTEQLTGLDLTGRMAAFLLAAARGRKR
jgi:glutathione synthase/RimK-type ligase-like ATP-grasp enzyme